MKITVKFIRAGFPMGLAYFAGDEPEIEEKTAKELIELQFAIPVKKEDSADLPEDLPCREILIKNEIFTTEDLLKIEDLKSITGIGEKSEKAIKEYLVNM